PPSPTLFPYTTLFRSRAHRFGGRIVPSVDPLVRILVDVVQLAFRPVVDDHRCVVVASPQSFVGRRLIGRADPAARVNGAHVHAADRKSTRLNSSHVAI